jgi:catechol 2,3-dioxygenase-like lactoylglutathione lyase family enzyme
MTDFPPPSRYETTEATTDVGLGLHHVQLAIPRGGEHKAREFFVGAMGLTEIQKPPALAARGGLWVRGDNLEIHLGVEDDFRAARKAHPGILIRDIDAMAARFEEHDVEVTWDDNFPNFRRFYVADCYENRIEFLSPTDA